MKHKSIPIHAQTEELYLKKTKKTHQYNYLHKNKTNLTSFQLTDECFLINITYRTFHTER